MIDPLVDLIQQVVASQDLFDSTERVRMCVAIEHALQNAMIRGNLEIAREEFPVVNANLVEERASDARFKDRKVFFQFVIAGGVCDFTVRDDGNGFDVSEIPSADDPEAFKDGIGRGLVLIQAFMKDVEFAEGGREVRMKKTS